MPREENQSTIIRATLSHENIEHHLILSYDNATQIAPIRENGYFNWLSHNYLNKLCQYSTSSDYSKW